jgi:hypothetical protein
MRAITLTTCMIILLQKQATGLVKEHTLSTMLTFAPACKVLRRHRSLPWKAASWIAVRPICTKHPWSASSATHTKRELATRPSLHDKIASKLEAARNASKKSCGAVYGALQTSAALTYVYEGRTFCSNARCRCRKSIRSPCPHHGH